MLVAGGWASLPNQTQADQPAMQFIRKPCSYASAVPVTEKNSGVGVTCICWDSHYQLGRKLCQLSKCEITQLTSHGWRICCEITRWDMTPQPGRRAGGRSHQASTTLTSTTSQPHSKESALRLLQLYDLATQSIFPAARIPHCPSPHSDGTACPRNHCNHIDLYQSSSHGSIVAKKSTRLDLNASKKFLLPSPLWNAFKKHCMTIICTVRNLEQRICIYKNTQPLK